MRDAYCETHRDKSVATFNHLTARKLDEVDIPIANPSEIKSGAYHFESTRDRYRSSNDAGREDFGLGASIASILIGIFRVASAGKL